MSWKHIVKVEVRRLDRKMSQLYYTAPEDSIFNEIKQAAIEIWQGYDDTFGYASEKISRISDMENIGDNVMYIFSMFDTSNQQRLARRLSVDARRAIGTRLLDAGMVGNLGFVTRENIELGREDK